MKTEITINDIALFKFFADVSPLINVKNTIETGSDVEERFQLILFEFRISDDKNLLDIHFRVDYQTTFTNDSSILATVQADYSVIFNIQSITSQGNDILNLVENQDFMVKLLAVAETPIRIKFIQILTQFNIQSRLPLSNATSIEI